VKLTFFRPPSHTLILVQQAVDPCDRLSVDFNGPRPYLFIGIDEYSSFPFVFSCKNTRSSTVVECLSWLFCILGFTSCVQSHWSFSLVSLGTRAFLTETGIAFGTLTPYHPKGNSQCERANQTVWRTVKLLLHDRNLLEKQTGGKRSCRTLHDGGCAWGLWSALHRRKRHMNVCFGFPEGRWLERHFPRGFYPQELFCCGVSWEGKVIPLLTDHIELVEAKANPSNAVVRFLDRNVPSQHLILRHFLHPLSALRCSITWGVWRCRNQPELPSDYVDLDSVADDNVDTAPDGSPATPCWNALLRRSTRIRKDPDRCGDSVVQLCRLLNLFRWGEHSGFYVSYPTDYPSVSKGEATDKGSRWLPVNVVWVAFWLPVSLLAQWPDFDGLWLIVRFYTFLG